MLKTVRSKVFDKFADEFIAGLKNGFVKDHNNIRDTNLEDSYRAGMLNAYITPVVNEGDEELQNKIIEFFGKETVKDNHVDQEIYCILSFIEDETEKLKIANFLIEECAMTVNNKFLGFISMSQDEKLIELVSNAIKEKNSNVISRESGMQAAEDEFEIRNVSEPKSIVGSTQSIQLQYPINRVVRN